MWQEKKVANYSKAVPQATTYELELGILYARVRPHYNDANLWALEITLYGSDYEYAQEESLPSADAAKQAVELKIAGIIDKTLQELTETITHEGR